MKVVVTEHQETMVHHDPDVMEFSSDESDEHKACRLFALKEHRRRAPSPEPLQDCTVEHVLNDGNTKIIRLFYRADMYFKGIQNEHNQYLISEIYEPYDTSLQMHSNEWIVVDINNNEFDLKDNYNYPHIQKQLNICNSEFCFPSRSTGYVLKLQKIQSTENANIELVDDGLNSNDLIKIKFTQHINHFIEYETNKGLLIKHIVSDALKKYGIQNNEWSIIEIDGNRNILQHDTQTIEAILNDKLCSHHQSYIVTFKKQARDEIECGYNESKHIEMEIMHPSRQKYNELHGNWATLALQNVDHGTYYYSISDLNIKDIRKNGTYIIIPEGSLCAQPNIVKIADDNKSAKHSQECIHYEDESHINTATNAEIDLSNDVMHEHMLLEKDANIEKLQKIIMETKNVIKTISLQLQTAGMKIKIVEKDKQQLSEDGATLKQQYALLKDCGIANTNMMDTNADYFREELQKTKKEIQQLRSSVDEEKSLWKVQEMTVFEAQCESMNAMKDAELETLKREKDSEITVLKCKIKELLDECAEYKANDK